MADESQESSSKPLADRWRQYGLPIALSLIAAAVGNFLGPIWKTLQTGTATVWSAYLDDTYIRAVANPGTYADVMNLCDLCIFISVAQLCACAYQVGVAIGTRPNGTSFWKAYASQWKSLTLSIFGGIVFVTSLWSGYFTCAQAGYAHAVFEKRNMALDGLLTQPESSLLQRKWAFIKNREDFINIMHMQDSFASMHKVVLPGYQM